MADDLSKDIVGARINIDTSKILPAFKVIDDGAKQNAANFKLLNAELAITERNYKSLATAMDKIVLTSDERRKKILAESNALVAQRTAQAELLNAKKNQLDRTNQLVDSKLKSQQALTKTRQDALENQERQHLAKMALIQTQVGGQRDLLKARLDREFAVIKTHNLRTENMAQMHAAKMAVMSGGSVLDRSSQYMLAGTIYYNAVRGATEAIAVLKDFEYALVNIKRVMGDTVDLEFVKKSMISDAKEYGYALRDVGEVYSLIGQLGFNEKETASLAQTAFMAKNVEQSFRDAAQAQELLTGAILNYNLEATQSERLLDRINEVSNNYATTSVKLLQGINRTGAAARNAGVDINDLIGYLTVLNQAGFTGSVAGNAIKSFISFSSRDIAIDKLEKYVGTIKQATGEMMPFSELLQRISEKWYTLADSERHEITQAIARGDQASRFIALMDNYATVIDVATTAENSFGSAQRENALAMTTLEKQSLQLKAAWDELIVSMGDSGFLLIIKAIVHEQKLLVDGFNSLPGPVRIFLQYVLALGTAFLVLNTGMRLFAGQTLVQMVAGLFAATKSMIGFKVATDAANDSQKALARTPIGAILTGISILLGVATVAWMHYNGAQNETRETMQQTDRDAMELGNRYKELKSIVDDNTKSSDEITTAQGELAVVIDKISGMMPNLISQWDAHGKVIDINIGKLTEFMDKNRESIRIVENDNIKKLDARKGELEIERKIKEAGQYSELQLSWFDKQVLRKNEDEEYQDREVEYNRRMIEIGKELEEIEAKKKNSQDTLDILDGKAPSTPEKDKNHGGKTGTDEEIAEEYKLRKEDFNARMSEFRHLVNIEKEGYKEATDQLKILQAIRTEYSDLEASDLYGIDEDIHRTKTGNKVKAEGIKATKVGKTAFEKAEDLISHKKAMGQLTEEMELDAWVNLRSMVASGTDLAMKADEKIYASKKALNEKAKRLLEESYSLSNNFINHQRAIGQMSEKEEYEAWKRVQARYVLGGEQRKRADEEVYAAKQALLKQEEQSLDKFVKVEKDRLQTLKKAELDRIQTERDAYVEAQDEKIKALQRLMDAEEITNEDQDYDKNLAEKQARLGVLASAVGPEGIKERKDLLKEIEELKVEHNRVLRRRDLEAQKLALEDEKKAKEKAFDDERKAVETQYENLLSAFDKFSNDAEGRAETLKQLQILKESEKNTEILKNLDTFIFQYQQKMSSIGSLSKTQAEIDFEKYKANQAIWNDPNSTKAQKQAANQENVSFRDKYGISQTDYAGLQHFSEGGAVQGRRGEAVPVIAHGRELILNEMQQSNLFKLLNFSMPQLSYSMPSFSMASGSSSNTAINNYYTISSGDVNLHDKADITSYFNERDNTVKRMQARSGVKTR